jgi:membrane protein YdbS with pleckstrin-like domain
MNTPEPAGAPAEAKTAWPSLKLTIVGVVALVLAFILTQLFFVAGGWLDVLGFVAFAVMLVSAVVTIVGVIGCLWRLLRQR